MSFRRFSVGAIVLIAVSASAVAIYARRPVAPSIEVARTSPRGDPSAEIECEGLDSIDFAYEVVNRGRLSIKGVKLGTKCSCEQLGRPPVEIPPGERATIGFRLQAPRVGLLRRKIPLLVDGSDEPAVELEVALRVRFEPPELMPPSGFSLTFVNGATSAQELVLEAIEATQDLHWIRGLDLDPAGGIELQPLHVEDLPEADPALTLRRYHFPLVNRSLPTGQYRAAATVRTRDGFPPIAYSFLVRVHVMESVAIVPNPLVIRYGSGLQLAPSRVKIVNRTGKKANVTPAKYDEDLLEVVAVQQVGPVAEFDIAPIAAPTSGREAQVEFSIGNGEDKTLVVRFEPTRP